MLAAILFGPWRSRFHLLAAIFVLLDIPFLCIQILLWPCFHCLVVALLFGGILFVSADRHQKWMNRILGIWFILFCVNAVSVARESIPPWPIFGNRAAPIKLYFSPTCPSCQAMLDALLEKGEMSSRIALYPISKSSDDTHKILELEKRLKEGVSIQIALRQYQKGNDYDGSLADYWRIKILTFCNLASMSRYGITSVPFLITQSPFWQKVKTSQTAKEDCPVFSKNSQGVCEDDQSGGVKNLFESKSW